MTQFAGLDALQALAVTQPLRAADAERPVRRRHADQDGAHDSAFRYLASRAREHGPRLAIFAVTSMNVFAAGLLSQVILVRYAGIGHVSSYIAQTIASVQLSFLLSRFLTRRDRDAGFVRALARFNVKQFAVTGLGIAGYAGLERLGVNYVAANVAVTAVLTPASFLSSHKLSPGERTRLRWRVTAVPWPLLAVLGVQAGLSLRLVWRNTAFEDEALYIWAGHLEWAHWLHGTPVPNFSAYFSGAPVIYPPLVAVADHLGGLAAARLLSMAFMLGATVLLYGAACRLFDRRTAVAAVTLFAVFGPGDQLGAFATYDAMAIFLTAFAAWLVVRAEGGLSEPLLICAGVALATADATKYASALWNPVVIAMAALVASAGGRLRRLLRAARLGIYTAIPVAAALHVSGAAYERGIMWTTLDRQASAPIAPVRVLDIAWGWLALLLLLGVLGMWLAWYDHGRPWILPVLFMLAGVLAPVAQARIGEIISLHKHVVFGAWFLCMIAGYAVSRISYLDGRLTQGAVISGVLVGAFAMTGFVQATAFMVSWPPAQSMIQALGKSAHTGHCPCLIFQESAAHYYLPAAALAGGVIGPWVFSYADTAAQQELSGVPAMAAAIGNGYFGAVELDATQGSATYGLLSKALRRSYQYKLVSSTPWALHPGEPTQVWMRAKGDAR